MHRKLLNKLFSPIVVIVTDTSWTAYGTNEPSTPRDKWLYTELSAMGGVNHSVPAGTYHFNIIGKRIQLMRYLIPVK